MRLTQLLETVSRGHEPGPPPPCRCGHISRAHEHYRSGSDCALCRCGRYRRHAGPVVSGISGQVATIGPARPFAVPGGAHERPGAA